MRALVLLVLLASFVHADDDDPLVLLRRSFEKRNGYGCADHLATLRAQDVPDSTTIQLIERPDLPRGRHSLAALRVVCEKRMREHARDEAQRLIQKAMEFPWAWAAICIDRWPLAIAAGAVPTERVMMRVHSRHGQVIVSGTLEQLYERNCENAYTPRRRHEQVIRAATATRTGATPGSARTGTSR